MSGYDEAILSWREELAKKGAHREDYTAVRRRGRQAASYWKRRNKRMTPDHTPSVEVTQREELIERYLTDLAVHPYSTLRESATRLSVSNEELGSVVQRLRRDGRVESQVRKWSRARTFYLKHEDAIDLKAMQEWLETGAGTATVQDLVKALLRVTREVSRLRNVVLQERVDRIAAQMLAGKR